VNNNKFDKSEKLTLSGDISNVSENGVHNNALNKGNN